MPHDLWRDWQADELRRQRRRPCSISGCKEVPVRVCERPAPHYVSGVRRFAYCGDHAAAIEPATTGLSAALAVREG